MFTGLIEGKGKVSWIEIIPGGRRLHVILAKNLTGLRTGDSLAVNGCCLTLVRFQREKGTILGTMDLLEETWKRTQFSDLKEGSFVNLERSLRADGRFGGHFVTGHIDAVGKILRLDFVGLDLKVEISTPKEMSLLLVPKGSVAVDGVSLTVAEVKSKSFVVWLIPHTVKETTFSERGVGDRVNLEGDLLGKYVARQLSLRSKTA